MLRQGQPDSGEGCILLQTGPTCSLVAKFPHIQSSLAVHEFRAAEEEHRERGPGRVCEPLMPDVVAPKVHQNNRSYMSSADLPSDSLTRIKPGERLHGEP